MELCVFGGDKQVLEVTGMAVDVGQVKHTVERSLGHTLDEEMSYFSCVRSEAIKVIGVKGQTIRDVTAKSNIASILVLNGDGDPRLIQLTGTKDALKGAKKELETILARPLIGSPHCEVAQFRAIPQFQLKGASPPPVCGQRGHTGCAHCAQSKPSHLSQAKMAETKQSAPVKTFVYSCSEEEMGVVEANEAQLRQLSGAVVTCMRGVVPLVHIGGSLSSIGAAADVISQLLGHRLLKHTSPSSVAGAAVDPWESVDGSGHSSVLVIGETGAGKSTVVNTFASFFLKGKFDAPKVVIPTTHHAVTEEGFALSSETNVAKGNQSQTNTCSRYCFSKSADTSLTLVDTPGLCDTRGRRQDDANLDLILGCFRDRSLPPLKAIILVINGQVGRFKLDIVYCMTKLRGVIPDVLFRNIVVVFTHTPTAALCLFDRRDFGQVLGVDIAAQNTFYFENSAFVLSAAQAKADKATSDRVRADWKRSMGMVDDVVARVSQLGLVEGVGVVITRIQLNRDTLKATLHGVRLKIANMQATQEQLEKMDKLVAAGQLTAAKFQNYTQTTTLPATVELVDASYHSTICSTCNHVCHNGCGLSPIATPGSHQFTSCAAFSGNNCTHCPRQCSYTAHYHALKTMRTVPGRSVQTVMADIKAQFDGAVSSASTAATAAADIARAKRAVEDSIRQEIGKLDQACRDIVRDCSGFNLAAELGTVMQQIETEKVFMTNLTAQASANQFIATIRSIVDGLSVHAFAGGGGGPSRRGPTLPSKR